MTTTDTQKVPVTTKALIARINRRLRHDDYEQVLKTTRGERTRFDFGDYFIVNLATGFVDAYKVDPEELGREIGVLKPWEEVR